MFPWNVDPWRPEGSDTDVYQPSMTQFVHTLGKDHRTGFENGNVQAVMDGDLDGFINAYLKALSNGTLEK